MSGGTIVIGAGTSGLTAAIALARAGKKVTVLEAADEIGGALREFEFHPGFKAPPFAGEVGWLPPEVARGLGLTVPAAAPAEVVAASPLESGGWLSLSATAAATAAGLRGLSAADAAKWEAFAGRIGRLAGFMGAMYLAPPPRIDAAGLGEFIDLAKLGRKLKSLGREEMIEVLRVVPMAIAEILDEWFESEPLKALLAAGAVTDLGQGPMAGGTAFTFLHRHVGLPAGAIRATAGLDPRAVVTALAGAAKAAGVTIRLSAAVERIEARDERVTGVTLAGGESIAADTVVSTLDPYRSLLELLDPVHLEPDFIRAVRNIRFRGVASKVMVALDGLPDLPPGFAGVVSLAPTVRYLERAADAVKYGAWSADPLVEVRFPSIARPDLAPAGKHVAVLHVQYTPYRLKTGTWDDQRAAMADRAVAVAAERIPGFGTRILGRGVMTPLDLERTFGCREGAVGQGELMLDQILFMRPVAGWSRSATPVEGLFLAGAGNHPGPGIVGATGWLAAQAALAGRAR